jgi:hypothetical protein
VAISFFVTLQPMDVMAAVVMAHGSVGIVLSAFTATVVPVPATLGLPEADGLVVPDPAFGALLPLEHPSGTAKNATQHAETLIRRTNLAGM